LEAPIVVFWAVLGIVVTATILWDGFETIVYPRRVTRKMRLSRLFYRLTWLPWLTTGRLLFSGKRLETYLSFYGPLSLLFLLVFWACGLVIGFGLLHWASGSASASFAGLSGYWANLYLSGTTFFTLGLGDIAPQTTSGKVLTVMEAGLGFGFLALVIGFLPAINQSFARREIPISLLDTRAGSPPSAFEILERYAGNDRTEELRHLMVEWERWAAEVLEGHLSYPMLAFFRSHHDNQSWLSALTAILDASAFIVASGGGTCRHQAELTFAMARHALVDTAVTFNTLPKEPPTDRLSGEDLVRLRDAIHRKGTDLPSEPATEQKIRRLRHMYEPHLQALADYLCISIPGWFPDSNRIANWQTSTWGWVQDLDEDSSAGTRKHTHFQ
jgi:hypothetical protein